MDESHKLHDESNEKSINESLDESHDESRDGSHMMTHMNHVLSRMTHASDLFGRHGSSASTGLKSFPQEKRMCNSKGLLIGSHFPDCITKIYRTSFTSMK